MFCSNCGHENATEASFCAGCGSKVAKRLCKSPDDKKLYGVAGGLGAYFGLNSNRVRVAFVLLSFAFGVGAVAYIILVVLMPNAEAIEGRTRTTREKAHKRKAIARNDEGVRLLQAGDYEGAAAVFTAAIELDPRFETAYRNRAQAHRRLHRSREADADLAEAKSLRDASDLQKFIGKGVGGRGNFRVAFAWTAIPIVSLGFISTAGAVAEGFYFLWLAGLGLGLLALLVAIGFAIARKGRAASGILAGFGVGIMALALSCFANLSIWGFN